MLLTITSTARPATDLGFLLHKNPANLRTASLSFGDVHVFWPEASEARATCAMLVDVDPIALSRHVHDDDRRPLAPYVNDRPYVASSFVSVALSDVFGTAMAGRSKDRPDLVDVALPLEVRLDVVPCRSEDEVHALFEPLGYRVTTSPLPLDDAHPDWGPAPYVGLTLAADVRVRDLLSHLYVLLPVLDEEKHYFVGADEAEKLLKHGEGWLATHPARELVVRRYLKHRRALVRETLAALDVDESPRRLPDDAEEALERPLSLDEARLQAVTDVLVREGARSVADLGCGEGKLVERLLPIASIERVLGVDVAVKALKRASARLDLDRMPERLVGKLVLRQGSVVYRDADLAGYDAAALVEVIEHLDPWRLEALARSVFGAGMRVVVVTTPNAEYNPRFPRKREGFRHPDHRFEWTRAELASWADAVAKTFGYVVRYEPIGPVDPDVGAPTQMAIFLKEGA